MSESVAAAPAKDPQWLWERRKYFLSLISSAGLVFSLVWGIYQYVSQQREQTVQQAKDADKQLTQQKELGDRELKQRRAELDLMIWREKKEGYAALVDAAAEVAMAKDKDEAKSRAPKYLAQFYGRVHMVPHLDEEVRKAKTAFAEEYWKYRDETPNTALPKDSLTTPLQNLSHACQKCLEKIAPEPAN